MVTFAFDVIEWLTGVVVYHKYMVKADTLYN